MLKVRYFFLCRATSVKETTITAHDIFTAIEPSPEPETISAVVGYYDPGCDFELATETAELLPGGNRRQIGETHYAGLITGFPGAFPKQISLRVIIPPELHCLTYAEILFARRRSAQNNERWAEIAQCPFFVRLPGSG